VYLSHNKFTDISFMSKYVYSMKMLVLWDVKLVKLCKLNAPLMQKLYMNVNCIESLESMRGSNLPELSLVNFSDNKIKDLSPLNDMKLTSINYIYVNNNKVTKLCCLNLPTLAIIQLKQNPINNVDDFVKSKLSLN
jgi:Leucine-rich repeat (LRR) protein